MADLNGIQDLVSRYNRVKQRYAHRDARMGQVRAIREGRISDVAPDVFPESGPWQEPIVANMIDVAARDMAETIAPLPSFNCTSPTMVDEKSRANATLKTKVAVGYVSNSDLQVQMYTAADWYVTYGFLPFRVEIDYDERMPVIRALDPVGCYVEKDRFNRVVALFQSVLIDRDELANKYPEFAPKLRDQNRAYGPRDVEVVFYHDKDWDIAFLNGAEGVLLEKAKNPVGKVLVKEAARPGATNVPRGQFDDVIFVQLAKARFALLALNAASDAVNAPLAVPADVPEVPFGPGATIRSNQPGAIGKVDMRVDQSTFAEQAQLDRELTLGARFPQVRTGNMDNSVVTGRGVQALMGGYDSQIRTHQAIFARALAEIIALCFEVDEKLFGGQVKTLRGSEQGAPFEIKYDPAKVLKGDYTVDATYGLMAGLDPNRWLVFALQARAEKMFSRDFMRRNMPVDLDVEEEARKLDIEDLEEAAKQAIMGYAQSIPVMASQGQDPAAPLAALAKVIDDRRKGKPLADSVVEAFTPEPPPEAPEGAVPGAEGMGGPGGQPPYGLGPTGLLKGVAPGQAGMGPGGRPDLQTMLASLNGNGQPNLSAGVSRAVAV